MKRAWWKEAVVYQIYPRSFYDSDGDGVGELRGIISKLDYLAYLGIDVVWLCPVYQSPNDDNGYDISDYYQIMKEFGTMSDFDDLLDGLHKRGIKLIMDLVVNHTSDEHPWFIESRSSRDNPKRDFYIWRQGKNGREPNNWRSYFTKSAWEFDEKTGEYYLHLFSKKQPDLNWRNPEVRAEIYKMMTWWLEKGIDGFRMDVINLLVKAEGFPDAPPLAENEDEYVFAEYLYANQPGIHEIIKEMNQKVLSRYDIMTVGETLAVTPEIGALYVKEDRGKLNMIFHFEAVGLGGENWDLLKFKNVWQKWYKALKEKSWNSIYLGNHDQPRQVTRFGNDGEYCMESAKLLAVLILTLPGTPFIYQGDEIGMTNVSFPSIEDYRDIETINRFRERVEKGQDPAEALRQIQPRSRDNARTPMQWNTTKNAGFTTGEPWIKVNPNFMQINVENEQKNPDSILNFYRKLICLRKKNPVFVYGDFTVIDENNPTIFAYTRSFEKDTLFVLLNFSSQEQMFQLPDEIRNDRWQLLMANYKHNGEHEGFRIRLLPWEARIYLSRG